MNTYNSMKEFQDSVYAAAIQKQGLNSMCQSQCKRGTVKAKVRSAKDDGTSINMTSSNLSSVAQDYVDNHMKITKKIDQTLELSSTDEITITKRKIDQSSASKVCNLSVDRSFEITGNVSYGAAEVSASASYADHTDTTTSTSETHYSDDTVTFVFKGTSGTVEIYYNKYTCSDSPVLDITYTFDKITVKAVCTYKDEAGTTWNSGAERHESRTYNLADLGFTGPVIIKTPVVFNVSCSDEWMSKDIL